MILQKSNMPVWRTAGRTPARPLLGEVTFGDPSRKCAGTGICRVLIQKNSSLTSTCSGAKALIWPPEGGRLRVAFPKSCLCPQAREQHFSGMQFIVAAAVKLPDNEKWEAAGILQGQILLPGIYPVRETESFLWIEVDVA